MSALRVGAYDAAHWGGICVWLLAAQEWRPQTEATQIGQSISQDMKPRTTSDA